MDRSDSERSETNLFDLILDVSNDLRVLWNEDDMSTERFEDLVAYISVAFVGMLNCSNTENFEQKCDLISFSCESIMRKLPNGLERFDSIFNRVGPKVVKDFLEKADKGPLKAPGYAAARVGLEVIGKDRLSDVFLETANIFLSAYKKLLGPLKVVA